MQPENMPAGGILLIAEGPRSAPNAPGDLAESARKKLGVYQITLIPYKSKSMNPLAKLIPVTKPSAVGLMSDPRFIARRIVTKKRKT